MGASLEKPRIRGPVAAIRKMWIYWHIYFLGWRDDSVTLGKVAGMMRRQPMGESSCRGMTTLIRNRQRMRSPPLRRGSCALWLGRGPVSLLRSNDEARASSKRNSTLDDFY